MITHLAVCGDSFSVGHGLPPEVQFEHSFGGLVADHFGLEQLVYGRSGCCNFIIYLQIEKIIEQVKADLSYRPFVLISTTWTERLTFPLSPNSLFLKPDLSQVDYLNYEPYRESSPVPRKLAFQIDKTYRLISETLPDLQHLRNKVDPRDIPAIDLYSAHLYDPAIKEIIDYGLLTTAHRLLVNHNIPHLFFSPKRIDTIDKSNNLKYHWKELLDKYPDNLGTGHCNEQGHRIMANQIISYITSTGLIN